MSHFVICIPRSDFFVCALVIVHNMTVWILFTVTCFFVDAGSVENIYPNNGWRPTSIEKVLELQRDFIKTPDLQFVKTLRKPPERPAVMGDFENKHLVKIPQNSEITKNILKENNVVSLSEHYEEENDEHRELIKLVSPPYKEKIKLEDTTSNTPINYLKSKLQRKAKLIDNPNIVTIENRLINGRESNQKRDETKDSNAIVGSTTTYAVKENLEVENPIPSNQKLVYNKGSDSAEKATINTKNNLTVNLLDILAKYNIRVGDNLRNYDISLRENTRNPHNHDFIFLPVPIKVPVKYNNANHLPVDPLLAVFLSNYGHYVPSLYGIHSGYNNLYGYLASNNIHNNKPFGSYKIFSDTDSFH